MHAHDATRHGIRPWHGWGLWAGLLATALCWNGAYAAESVQGPSAQQSDSSASADQAAARAAADQLLKDARGALQKGDLQRAHALVVQAEGKQVRYGLFYLGETPGKLRRAIARAAAAKQDSGRATLSAEMFQSESASPVRDQEGNPLRSVAPQQQVAEAQVQAPEQESVGAIPAKTSLVQARLALAAGEIEEARRHVAAVAEEQREYGVGDDTPAKVQQAIEAHEHLLSRREDGEAWKRAYAEQLLQQAEALLPWGELDAAGALGTQAAQLGIAYGPFQRSPQRLAEKIAELRPTVATASLANHASEELTPDTGNKQADFPAPLGEPTNLVQPVQAGSEIAEIPPPPPLSLHSGEPLPLSSDHAAAADDPSLSLPGSPAATSMAHDLLLRGEEALAADDRARALELFQAAYQQRQTLDPHSAQRLGDHLQLLARRPARETQEPSLLETTAARDQLLARQLAAEITRVQSQADAMLESDPKGALAQLESLRENVTNTTLDAAIRGQLVRRVDGAIERLEQYVEQNRAQIEQDEINREILDDIERRRFNKLDTQDKLAALVQEANRLQEQQRFDEMVAVAKRAIELAPDEPVSQQLRQNAIMGQRNLALQRLLEAKEEGFYNALQSAEEAAEPFDDRYPLIFGDAKEWNRLTQRREEQLRREGGFRSERELDIERKLETPVSATFEDRPLSQVIDQLAELAQINIVLDPRGLGEELVASDTPVSIDLEHEVSLKSALHLILEPLNLDFVIKDEVLKITSSQLRDTEVMIRTYNVADLVVPIPNFTHGNLGITGQLQAAYHAMGYGGGAGGGPLAVVANSEGSDSAAMINPAIAAQIPAPGSGSSGMNAVPTGFGPSGVGGAAQADFDTLIELIQNTIQPTTWDENGGNGSVREFPTNLSLVVSQTQDVHDQIRDLLQQLRRLQDLQVTIEVRFIRLSDRFFERIGVDFDFNIEDGVDDDGFLDTDGDGLIDVRPDRVVPSATVGLDPATSTFTADLDIPFRQGSFPLAVPQFGAFDPSAGAQLGFAILSDIEAFFLIEAAQGDRRSNVMQAPKVTLFNGQQAFISDATQMPFVVSVVPVVGDFAAAQMPVIVVLSEGTFMSIQAVVSPDRRFVRLTVVPFFSEIGEVEEFTFEGSSTTTTSSDEDGIGDDEQPEDRATASTVTRQGTTVQLPSFSFVTVTTTVSVPDGGTVLLGGIKRLQEGRTERGVPMLSKLPYINRLFKNVGIGREA